MAITFEIKPHRKRNAQVVEVLKDGKVVGVIYPDEEGFDIRLISAHFAGELASGSELPAGIELVMENDAHEILPIPYARVRFDARPYTVGGGRLIRG